MTAFPPDLEAELEREHPNGFAWALYCCQGDRTEAEDVLHLTYVKILEGRARFAGRSTFRTWFFGVIRRTAWEQRRAGVLRWLRLATWRVSGGDQRDPAPDPAGQVIEADTRRRLGEALGKLSRRQREMMPLVFYQDLSGPEA